MERDAPKFGQRCTNAGINSCVNSCGSGPTKRAGMLNGSPPAAGPPTLPVGAPGKGAGGLFAAFGNRVPVFVANAQDGRQLLEEDVDDGRVEMLSLLLLE